MKLLCPQTGAIKDLVQQKLLTTSSQVRTTQKGGSTFGELTSGFFQIQNNFQKLQSEAKYSINLLKID